MLSSKGLVLTWVAAVLSTLLAWGLSTHGLAVSWPSSKALAACLIALSAVKAGLIAWNYMEMRRAPHWLQALLALWMSVSFCAIVALYVDPRVTTWLIGRQISGL